MSAYRNMNGSVNTSFNGSSNFHVNDPYLLHLQFERVEEYILPILIGIGTVSNGLTLVIFCLGKQKQLSVSIYMCAYCIGNIAALYFLFGLHFLTLISDFPELENFNSVGCALLKFIEKVVSYSSVWFVVGMTIDRYIAICHPSRATKMCTIFMAKVAVGIILIGLVVMSVHAMWVYELDYAGRCNMFPPLNELMTVHLHMWNILSATAFVYLPLIILLILNVLLTFGICFRHRSSSSNRRNSVSLNYTKTVVGLSVTRFALLFPITIHNIFERTGTQIPMYTMYTFSYMRRISMVDVLLICLLLSRSFRQEIRNICKQFGEPKKSQIELANMTASNSLLKNEEPATNIKEEDTLV